MLSRALNTKPRKSFRGHGEESFRSTSIREYEDFFIGFMEDLPLITCDGEVDQEGGSEPRWTLREVLRASVGVVGESRLGITEKVVLLEGRVCALKRFRSVRVRRKEFGRRIERLALVSRQCQYLVPVHAYLYAKRIKFVFFDFYAMGSLADLLTGAREFGHTALNWEQRLKIIRHTAKAIAFIHAQSPSNDTNLQLNIHGNLKTSNIMINIDFGARISNYGFTQFAKRVDVPDHDTGQSPKPHMVPQLYSESLSQKSDIYNFGIVVLDMLGGPKALAMSRKYIFEKRDEIRSGAFEFFEFFVEGRERRYAADVLEIALPCTNRQPDARPCIIKILSSLKGLKK